ncbi:16232_t:CDS:10 [Rhizophagus irregularis]|nr:16232_t:CDS:10 [Rhizophagus irregularis]
MPVIDKYFEPIVDYERGANQDKQGSSPTRWDGNWDDRPGPDYKEARNWEKRTSVRAGSSFHFHNSTITGNSLGGNSGAINNIKFPKERNRERDQDESDYDFMPVRQLKRKKQLSLPKKNKESVYSAKKVIISALDPALPGNSPEYDKPHTPPHQICSISDNQDLIKRLKQEKLRAKSTYEPICSNIIDTTNKILVDRLKIKRDYKWDPVINNATNYIDELINNSDTRNEFRRKLQLPFVPSDETYSFSKHYEIHWVHRFADKLSLFFEAPRNPLLDKNSEGWINCHLLTPIAF